MEIDFKVLLIAIVMISIIVYIIIKMIKSTDYSIEDTIRWDRLCEKLINHYSLIESNQAVNTYSLYQNVLGILHRYKVNCYNNCTINFVKDTIVLTRGNKEYFEDFIFSIIEDKFYIEYVRSDTEEIKRPISIETLDKLFFKSVK